MDSKMATFQKIEEDGTTVDDEETHSEQELMPGIIPSSSAEGEQVPAMCQQYLNGTCQMESCRVIADENQLVPIFDLNQNLSSNLGNDTDNTPSVSDQLEAGSMDQWRAGVTAHQQKNEDFADQSFPMDDEIDATLRMSNEDETDGKNQELGTELKMGASNTLNRSNPICQEIGEENQEVDIDLNMVASNTLNRYNPICQEIGEENQEVDIDLTMVASNTFNRSNPICQETGEENQEADNDLP